MAGAGAPRLDSPSLAAVAASVLAATATGNLVLVVALVCAAASEMSPALTAALVATSVAVRFGTTSLSSLAGAQAVLGVAGAVGPTLGAVATWTAATALVVVAPHRRLPAIAFGVLAGLVVVGPGGTTSAVFVRASGAVVGAALAVVASRRVPPRFGAIAGPALAAAAVAAAAATR